MLQVCIQLSQLACTWDSPLCDLSVNSQAGSETTQAGPASASPLHLFLLPSDWPVQIACGLLEKRNSALTFLFQVAQPVTRRVLCWGSYSIHGPCCLSRGSDKDHNTHIRQSCIPLFFFWAVWKSKLTPWNFSSLVWKLGSIRLLSWSYCEEQMSWHVLSTKPEVYLIHWILSVVEFLLFLLLCIITSKKNSATKFPKS